MRSQSRSACWGRSSSWWGSGPGGHRRFACTLSHDVLDRIPHPWPNPLAVSVPPTTQDLWEIVLNQLKICLRGKTLAMGSSRLPVVFSNTFVSCPHGREEVGLAVPSPGGLFLPSTYGCECDWPAMKDPLYPSPSTVRWPSTCLS